MQNTSINLARNTEHHTADMGYKVHMAYAVCVLPKPLQHSGSLYAFNTYLTLMWEGRPLMWTQTPLKLRPPIIPFILYGENPGSVHYSMHTTHLCFPLSMSSDHMRY